MQKVFITAGTQELYQAIEQGRGSFPITVEEIGDDFHAEAITSNNVRSKSLPGLISKLNEWAEGNLPGKVLFSVSNRNNPSLVVRILPTE